MSGQVIARDRNSLSSRASWGIADQVISSASNFLAQIIAVRVLSIADFGYFTVATSAWIIALGLNRAVAVEPLLIVLPPDQDEDQRKLSWGQALGATLWIGVAVAVVLAAASIPPFSRSVPLLPLAMLMGALLVQDTVRLGLIAEGRARAAAVIDSVWLLPLFLAMFVRTDSPLLSSPTRMLLLWGGSGALSAAAGLTLVRSRPVMHVWRWFRVHWHLIRAYVPEFLVLSGTSHAAYVAVAVLASPADLGQVRAAQVLVSPLTVIVTATAVIGVTEVRRFKTSANAVELPGDRPIAMRISFATCLVTSLYCGALFALPETVGRQLLGSNWAAGKQLLPQVSIAVIAAGAALGAGVVLRSNAAAGRILRARTVTGLVTAGLTVVGAIVAQGAGAAWGLASGGMIGLLAMWHELRGHTR